MVNNQNIRLGFLASHNGSTMQAIIDACIKESLNAEPVVLITNNSRSGAICRAKKIKMPFYRIIKEKTATFIQSPENFEKIKKIENLPKNLIISGDWTQNNLPCTIEGSIMSGKKAVEFLK